MLIRPAQNDDANGIAGVLHDLVTAGKRNKPADADFAFHHYIAHPGKIACHVAQRDDGMILGFQSIKLAEADNPYGAPVGWGLIGTHIRPTAARRGIGKELFTYTLEAARIAGVPAIEAFIGINNLDGHAYYDAMGFAEYRRTETAICKSHHLS